MVSFRSFALEKSSIQSFQIITETWDPIVVFILKQKLGPEIRGKWEEERKGSHECASLKEFLLFLDTRHKILINTPKIQYNKPREVKHPPVKTFAQTNTDVPTQLESQSNTPISSGTRQFTF